MNAVLNSLCTRSRIVDSEEDVLLRFMVVVLRHSQEI